MPQYLFLWYSSSVYELCWFWFSSDLANPILQNVGPQPIYLMSLNGYLGSSSPFVFAYTDRYASFKTMEDELHGLCVMASSPSVFALQRSFSASPQGPLLVLSFLEIPTNYMDQVTATSSTISAYGCWMDLLFRL